MEVGSRAFQLGNIHRVGRLVGVPDFRERTLRRKSFRGQRSLAGADFSRADLSAADLRGCDLRGAKFEDALLLSTRFEGADLTGASFEGAWTGRTRLRQGLSIGLRVFAGAALAVIGTGCLAVSVLPHLSPSASTLFMRMAVAVFAMTAPAVMVGPGVRVPLPVLGATLVLSIGLALSAWRFEDDLAVFWVLSMASNGSVALLLILIAGRWATIAAVSFCPVIIGLAASGFSSSNGYTWNLAAAWIGATIWSAALLTFSYRRRLPIAQGYESIHRWQARMRTAGGTSFRGATLSRANFTNANVPHTNFDAATLDGSSWDGCQSLDRAWFGGTPVRLNGFGDLSADRFDPR
jgi:uncharacterized protein YjbI with pentapeptide repeats